MSFEYWYMFPVALAVSTLALSSGVSGATFFTPMFLLGLGLPLRAAIAAGLMTATFGFASGLYGYARRGLIDYRLGGRLLSASVPAALLGAWAASRMDASLLRLLLGLVLLAIAASFVRREPDGLDPPPAAGPGDRNVGGGVPVPLGEGKVFAAAGGFFLGLISAGLGELNAYFLMKRARMPSPEAIATSVLVVAGTVVAAASGHLLALLQMDTTTRDSVLALITFTIPGVVIGAQIGCMVGSRVPRVALLRVLGFVFVVVAVVIVAPVLAKLAG